ncbi:MAG: helix-turn-helix transcriptional regulator, partial [Bacteroidales bacterium]|nr:helix-turn-helix transcriptional regulator [Bacteroidales bacterium]
MNVQQQSRNEYIHRINRVVDYIEAHLDDEHSLVTLAQVAHFSPFHFHRIFRALTGETINNYVKRIRLQMAGRMLLNDYRRSVSDIAVQCGFNSTAVFCRAFRDHYRRSTGEFRKYYSEEVSKNGQPNRKNSQSLLESSLYISDESINQNRIVHMKTNIEVKEMP